MRIGVIAVAVLTLACSHGAEPAGWKPPRVHRLPPAVEPIPGMATIAGRVLDAELGQAIAAATVEVLGSNRGNITNQDGYYAIAHVTPGELTVRAVAIGYWPVTMADLDVAEGDTLFVDFALRARVIEIDDLTVEANPKPR